MKVREGNALQADSGGSDADGERDRKQLSADPDLSFISFSQQASSHPKPEPCRDARHASRLTHSYTNGFKPAFTFSLILVRISALMKNVSMILSNRYCY